MQNVQLLNVKLLCITWLYKVKTLTPTAVRLLGSNPARVTWMLVLLCVVRIRCFPGKSDHFVDTHICGTLSASLLTLHILTLSYPRQTVRRIRAVLYVLSSHTWFGSIQALVTKEQSSTTYFKTPFVHCLVN